MLDDASEHKKQCAELAGEVGEIGAESFLREARAQ